MAHFGKTIVKQHLPQLQESWDEEMITKIEEQHHQLCLAYQQEDAIKLALDQCEALSNKTLMSFEDSWAIIQGRFDILCGFCNVNMSKI